MNKKRAAKGQWKQALNALAMRNRVHVGRDMSACYRELARVYDGCEVFGFPSGETCGSWTAPPAWEVETGRLTAPDGEVLTDWHDKKLSLWAYSPPFRGTVGLDELREHLFSIPAKPTVTPFHFRNQYRHWQPDWGFCLPDRVVKAMGPGDYTVEIDTRFEASTMEMVEQVHAGELADSVLFVGHFDHPEMCNDGLVGCLTGHEIVQRLKGRKTRLTYRMLSTVEIVGSVFYAEHRAKSAGVREALFIATSGARAPLQYQTSFTGTSFVDRVMRHVLRHSAPDTQEVPFREGILGNDEVAFDVGGVDIPCGSFLRAPFEEYHTDLDTPDAVDTANFEQVVEIVLRMVGVLENDAVLVRKFSGLPCLSSPELDLYLSPGMISHVSQKASRDNNPLLRNLPESVAASLEDKANQLNAMMTVLPIVCDGRTTMLDLAERVDLPFEVVDSYTDMWVEKGLLEKHWHHPFQPRDAA